MISHSQTNNPTVISCEYPQITGIDLHGRRVYIQERALEFLAYTSADTAQHVFRALASIFIKKTVYHHVLEDGVLLGVFDRDQATRFLEQLDLQWLDTATSLLQSIGYRPNDPQERYHFYPVLETDEVVAATCYDVQYFTFATTPLAAKRMYADNESIRKLRNDEHIKSNNTDLTLIKGRALAMIDPSTGTGPGKAPQYAERISAEALDQRTAQVFKSRIQDEIITELERITYAYFASPTAAQMNILSNMLRSSRHFINTSILKVSQ